MSFGKNRVQYKTFYWQYYRLNKYDTYFYEEGKELALNVAEIADSKITEIENFFQYSLHKRIIFIIYNTHSDFKQSNIGLVTNDDDYNIGGITQIIGNKVFIYNEGDLQKLEKQIGSAIAEVLLNELMYGTSFKDKITSAALISFPEWFSKGLISYVSSNWNLEIEDHVKDAIANDKYKKFNHLSGKDAVYAGHSLWYFIEAKYGKSVIPNILYLSKISKNIESGFAYVLGTPLKMLTYEWLDYYKTNYSTNKGKQDSPSEENLVRKPKRDRVYQQLKIHPGDSILAYTTNILGKYKVWTYNTNSDEHKCILKRGHKLDQITDYSYPLLAWHPSGELLSIIIEEEGLTNLYYYIIKEEQLETRPLFGYDKILDFSYSDDGKSLLFSAIRDGKTDIYVYTLSGNSTKRITRDKADDLHPRFINGSKQILFSSNRVSNNLEDIDEYAKNHDIFIYDYSSESNILTRLTNTPNIDERSPINISKHKHCFLSDDNGIINRHIADYDSIISFIDTTTHYRYFTTSHPISNYSKNILEHDYNPTTGKFSEIIYGNGKHNMYINKINTKQNSYSSEFLNTNFRKYLNKQFTEDSLEQIRDNIIAPQLPDSIIELLIKDTLINITNYTFETEKKYAQYLDDTLIDKKFNVGKQHVYFTAFYPNYVVNQIDFGFLSSSYQAFTGGAVYYNPGVNLFFKIGAYDLFENYKVTGGVRFAGNFDSNEYLLSVENLKKRTDKQIIFHRQAFTHNVLPYALIKVHTHELMYILKYPFSQVAAIKGTFSTRYDRNTFLAIDYTNLNRDNFYKAWAGFKLEYIFDNTRFRSLNLYRGTRFKIFAESFKQLNEGKTDLFVVGADFRHYINIHRDLIWANRFAASTSFGQSKLIYYLGGVDNWINLSSKVETFNYDIPIDYTKNYAYQALATNMRGFTQNIRNGNSFAVINSEIRWPIIKYFANRPIKSGMLANLQIIGFTDIGSAWTGKSPEDKGNKYNTEIIQNGPVTVVLDKQRSPIVYGYGFGVRTKLLGYFVRADWAWGVENNIVLPRIFYLSLNLDF